MNFTTDVVVWIDGNPLHTIGVNENFGVHEVCAQIGYLNLNSATTTQEYNVSVYATDNTAEGIATGTVLTT